MKRKVMTMFVLMAVAACSKPSTDLGTENPGPGGQEPAPAIEYEYTLMGVCGTIDTRISVGEAVAGRQPFTWDSRDKISLFGSDDALIANLTLSKDKVLPRESFSSRQQRRSLRQLEQSIHMERTALVCCRIFRNWTAATLLI